MTTLVCSTYSGTLSRLPPDVFSSHSNRVEYASVTTSAVSYFTASQLTSITSSHSREVCESAAGIISQLDGVIRTLASKLSSMPSTSIIWLNGTVNLIDEIVSSPEESTQV